MGCGSSKSATIEPVTSEFGECDDDRLEDNDAVKIVHVVLFRRSTLESFGFGIAVSSTPLLFFSPRILPPAPLSPVSRERLLRSTFSYPLVPSIRIYTMILLFGTSTHQTASGEMLVTDVLSDGAANDKLAVADKLCRVNGQSIKSMDYSRVLEMISGQLTLMLECSRLRCLDQEPPEAPRSSGTSDTRGGEATVSSEITTEIVGSESRESSPMQKRRRKHSITELLPGIRLQSRRASFGRVTLSRRPTVTSIRESVEEDTNDGGDVHTAEEVGHTRIAVTLHRHTEDDGFGFTLRQLHDGRLIVTHISSSISNWGRIQIGDILVSAGQEPASDVDKVYAAMEKKNVLDIVVDRPSEETVAKLGVREYTRRGSGRLVISNTMLLTDRLNQLAEERKQEETADDDIWGLENGDDDDHTRRWAALTGPPPTQEASKPPPPPPPGSSPRSSLSIDLAGIIAAVPN